MRALTGQPFRFGDIAYQSKKLILDSDHVEPSCMCSPAVLTASRSNIAGHGILPCLACRKPWRRSSPASRCIAPTYAASRTWSEMRTVIISFLPFARPNAGTLR